MVDAVVTYVLERVGEYLTQEVAFLRGVRKEVESLKNELQYMQCFVKDAEEKQVENALIRQWISDIRDIAYDTEDVLDTFMIKIHDPDTGAILEDEEGSRNMLQVNYEEGTSKRRLGFFASIANCSCISKKETSYKKSVHQKSNLYNKGKEIFNLRGIGKEIEDLRMRISDLSRKRELYDLKDTGSSSNTLGTLKELRRASSFPVEDNIVGFEDDANKLIAKLLEEEPRRFVISILGMGGLGKTTLAKKLYHNNDIWLSFDCHAWVYVSQDYKPRDLLIKIIKSFKIEVTDEKLEKMRQEDLERYLYNYLQNSSYLMVVDDVWQKEAWESLRRAFPDNKNGSRVIITTRIKEVAERSDERTHVHELRFLRPDESWKLFCEKASLSSNADERLKQLGREMVEKCGGLPLAIIVLGGLLKSKKSHEWHVVRDHIWRHLRRDSIHISYLLDLSFNHLPHQLKLCFLYFGLFPEDYEIYVEKLIRLLVAEGFIQEDEGQTMEEVAKDYIDELINRSLVQIEKRCWGRIATCRVHDLLRDLAIQKAKELNFIHFTNEIAPSARSSSRSSCRRQAANGRYLQLENCTPYLRSFLLFNQEWGDHSNIWLQLPSLCRRFRLLRVLDCEMNNIDEEPDNKKFPQEIEKLIHLKYLGLRNSYMDPSFIGVLQRLQTLDLSGKGVVYLPKEIYMLLELRHLIGNWKVEGHDLMIDSLKNLQTMKYVVFYDWNKVKYPENLVNLRELRIVSYLSSKGPEFSFDSIAKLKSLRILSVNLQYDHPLASLQPLGHCQRLVDLRLKGNIEQLPEDLDVLFPNLECLSLSHSLLKDDPMPLLEKLPNLMILDLGVNSYSGKEMVCTANGFLRLEILQLELNKLKELEVEEGGMLVLRGLRILNNPELRIPERLRSVPLPGEGECDNYLLLNHSTYIKF